MDPNLKGRNLVKRHDRVAALDDCDFDLMPGEILAVIGDNGAGNANLINVVSGAVILDKGTLALDGQKVRFTPPIEAREAGNDTICQTLGLTDAVAYVTGAAMPDSASMAA